MSPISDVEKRVKEIRRKTRRKYSVEDKIRIVLEGLRGEMTIAELCRREGIVQNLYYKWSRDKHYVWIKIRGEGQKRMGAGHYN